METEGDPDGGLASRDLDPLGETIASDGSGDTGAAGRTESTALAVRSTPERMGRYRLVRKLGEGGMGVVHLAHDDQLDRPVALKILRPGGNGDSRRLLREARSMARLSHPHIAAVFDVGTEGQDVYVAMEYVEGPTLRRWLDRSPPWPERLDVLLQAARGLTAAHAAGVTHRDFKPDNVIVGADGRARVLDFGLAKLAPRTSGRPDSTETQIGSIVGTPRYMAPEQLRTQPTGPEADQFAFCLTAYEAAYGQRPFSGEVFADVAVSVLTQPPAEPPAETEVPDALWPVLQQGLRVDPGDRFADMQALTDALERVAGASDEVPEVVSRPALRDAREDVRQQLTQAYADDLIDADEIDERLEKLENAEDPQAVRALVADLQPLPTGSAGSAGASGSATVGGVALALAGATGAKAPKADALAVREAGVPATRGGAGVPAVVAMPEVGRIVSVFSGMRRSGVWVPARVNQVFAMFGGAEIDLREARIEPGVEVELKVLVMFGGVEIIVPPGTHVQMDCTPLFGGAEQEDASEPADPDGMRIRVTGLVLFGGVEVIERLPGESGWAARKRRKAKHRALREAAKRKALPPGR